MFAKSKLKKLRKYSKRLIYDADDLIWIGFEKPHHFLTQMRVNSRLKYIVKNADLCTAPNRVIADELENRGGKVSVIPMALDEKQWLVKREANEKLLIGWAGAPANFVFLEPLVPLLKDVLEKHPKVELQIYSGKDPEFRGLRYTHVPFVPGDEAKAISQFDIGLLPLSDSVFSQGKSPIKGLQYMACSLAVILSPAKATLEIFKERETALFARNHDEWSRALEQLVTNHDLRKTLAKKAHKEFAKHYSTEVVYKKLKEIIE